MENGGEGGLDGYGFEYDTAKLFAYISFQIILGNQRMIIFIL